MGKMAAIDKLTEIFVSSQKESPFRQGRSQHLIIRSSWIRLRDRKNLMPSNSQGDNYRSVDAFVGDQDHGSARGQGINDISPECF